MTNTAQRKRVGLALSGGVGRGLAHIGVLAVLEGAGIPIDCVAGASVGALVGASYCAGLGSQRIREVATRLRWWHVASLAWPRLGFVSFDKLERWMVGLVGDVDFAELKIPLAVVASDMEKGQPVVLRQGRVAAAVRASCSVPGIVTPSRLNGQWLGDGGITDNLPAAILRQMGAEYVIGVDVFVSALRPGWGPLGMGLTAIEILVRRAGGGLAEADCLIVPELAGFSYLRLSQAAELIARGERAAQEKVGLIQAGLSG